MEKELFLKFTELENIFFLWDRTILQKDELTNFNCRFNEFLEIA